MDTVCDVLMHTAFELLVLMERPVDGSVSEPMGESSTFPSRATKEPTPVVMACVSFNEPPLATKAGGLLGSPKFKSSMYCKWN